MNLKEDLLQARKAMQDAQKATIFQRECPVELNAIAENTANTAWDYYRELYHSMDEQWQAVAKSNSDIAWKIQDEFNSSLSEKNN